MSALNPIEKTPPAPRPRLAQDPFTRLLNYLPRTLWGWRIELAAVSVAVWLLATLPLLLGVVIVAGVPVGVLAHPLPRRLWVELLTRSIVRRQWARASRHCGLETINHRVPRLVRIAFIPAGERARVRMPAGLCVADLEHEAEPLAAVLGIRELRVVRDPSNARYATAVLARRDPLDVDEPIPWPHAGADRLSLWEPIPIGWDDDGEVVSLSMVERNLLLGGEPGAGKSAAASMIVATGALDPEVRLWLVDGKLVELSMWRGCADRVIGFDLDAATAALLSLREEMTNRYRLLLASGKRKIDRNMGLSLYLVVVDELAFFTFGSDGRPNKEFNSVLRDLVSAAGRRGSSWSRPPRSPPGTWCPRRCVTCSGSAGRCAAPPPQASDTILGSGWATNGYSAVVDASRRGLGYLLAEGDLPTRLQAFYLDDQAVIELAERAALLRAAHAELRGLTVDPWEGAA